MTTKRARRQRRNPRVERFILEYLKDFNGTRAYKASHPNCHSDKAAATEAWKYLKNPEIAERVRQGEAKQHHRLRMEGAEALARISLTARMDISDAYDEDGNLLPIHLWPTALRRCVKSLKEGEHGVEVRFHDALRAQELMGHAAGLLRHKVDVTGKITIADIVEASWGKGG